MGVPVRTESHHLAVYEEIRPVGVGEVVAGAAIDDIHDWRSVVCVQEVVSGTAEE
ncbi:MAG TPA: hypothetical protein VK869_05515 [Rubrobacteraceae bacterium]|nr:hypothetical protein [Rubrobacteraceae bacterium]